MENCGTVLITGGTRGIGFASAQELVKLGFRDFILGYHQSDEAAQRAKQTLEQTPGVRVVLVKGDICEESIRDSLLRVVEETFDGSLYAIIHSAGRYLKVDPNNQGKAFDEYQTMYAKAFLHLVNTGVRYMEKLPHGGRIIALSTPGVNLLAKPRPFYFLPGCAKASMEYMARSFAHELASKRITCNVVIPGITDTEGWLTATPPISAADLAVQRCPMKVVIPPSAVGAAIAFLVSRQADFITGAMLPVDGGLMFV